MAFDPGASHAAMRSRAWCLPNPNLTTRIRSPGPTKTLSAFQILTKLIKAPSSHTPTLIQTQLGLRKKHSEREILRPQQEEPKFPLKMPLFCV